VKFSQYFLHRTRFRFIKQEWLEKALLEYDKYEVQDNDRIRYWVYIEEEKKWLRVIMEPDNETVFNAFFDRDYPENIL
jgi:hypothetical protein